MSKNIFINESPIVVSVNEETVRVIAVATQGPPGPQGPQGEPGESGGGTELPEAAPGSLLVRGADEWEPLGAGAEGNALVVADGVPAWGEVGGGGGDTVTPFGAILPALQSGNTQSWAMPGYNLSTVPDSSSNVAADMVLAPMYMAREMVANAVSVTVGMAAADALVRLGMYRATDGLAPDTLFADFGTVSAETTGVKAIAIDPLTIPAGWYFLASMASHTGARINRIQATAISGNSGPISTSTDLQSGTPRSKAYRVLHDPSWISDGLPDPVPAIRFHFEEVPFMPLRFIHS